MEESVFLIKWYGPFTSREEEKEWEKKQSFNCSLYLLHGKKKYAKTKEHYYCGESTRAVYERFCDQNHHIKELEDRLQYMLAVYQMSSDQHNHKSFLQKR